MLLRLMEFRRDMILATGEAAVISRHGFFQPVGMIGSPSFQVIRISGNS